MGLKSYLWEMVPVGGMVAVECLYVGLATMNKAAMSRGMSLFAYIVYSHALATLILLPYFFFFHRTKRPPLTWSLLGRFFLLGIFGITLKQYCTLAGINYSSPTLASAMSNLIPAFTFILAFIFRMEKVDFRQSGSQIKIMGTLVSISGAFIVILYKGPSIAEKMTLSPRFPSENLLPIPLSATASNWVLGGFFLAIVSLSVSIWNILQAATLKEYPEKMAIIFFYGVFGTIQCAVVSMIAERNPTAWTLRPDLELIAIFYSAVVGNVIAPYIETWCIYKKGPVFVATFKPFGIAIAALMGVIFLGDTLHLGSVIGAIIIALGFYGVMWGQSKVNERTEYCGVGGLKFSSGKTPLLQTERSV